MPRQGKLSRNSFNNGVVGVFGFVGGLKVFRYGRVGLKLVLVRIWGIKKAQPIEELKYTIYSNNTRYFSKNEFYFLQTFVMHELYKNTFGFMISLRRLWLGYRSWNDP